MTFGSLFTGIGGIDLGLERAGMVCKWQAEVDPYCVAVLEKHWPGVKRYGDVTTINWAEAEGVDLICGGFPCQPFSVAGKRRGAADKRNLWPEMLRAVQVVRPRWVVGENVPGIGDYLGTVCTDLEAEGYEVLPLELPAAALGAPHLRYRLFILAHTDQPGDRTEVVGQETIGEEGNRSAGGPGGPGGGGRAWAVADAQGLGEGRLSEGQRRSLETKADPDGRGKDVPDPERGQRDRGPDQQRGRPEGRTAPRGNSEDVADAEVDAERAGLRKGGSAGERRGRLGDGSGPGSTADAGGQGPEVGPGDRQRGPCATAAGSGWWATEPDVGRVAHGIPSRVDRLRALGNAVVPQVAEWIGQRIVEAEEAEPCPT